ncbi:MAG: tRNA (adenosine(37)-N6)-threonylcarbamoyltransferase complex transferase subunit TsaD [Phycisphaerales bacterium JB037]
MRILGLESSCDETAAAVVEDGVRVRSSIVSSQADLHEPYGGVVPEIASRAHVERIIPTLRAAMHEAGLTWSYLDAIAVGHRPGLIGSLLIGLTAAKSLAWAGGLPIVGIDHVHAHLYAGCLETQPAAFPALGLVVSGGHTATYLLESPTRLQRLGATIDDAVGEAFDKAATMLGLDYPGGPELDRLAEAAHHLGRDERAHTFPISRLKPGSLDFSFSGLKTAMLYAVRGRPGPGGSFERDHASLTVQAKQDLALGFRRAAIDAILLKLDRARKKLLRDGREPRSLLVGGGVSANSLLRRELASLADRWHIDLRLPPMEWCVDNAAMIAGLAHHQLAAGVADDLTLAAVPTTAC